MKGWGDLKVWDVVRLPEWFWINEDLLTVMPHITEMRRDFRRGEHTKIEALVEWTLRNPFAWEYLPIRQSQWFDLHELKPYGTHQREEEG